jgi:N6-adenosine-specific RNA methylase IME4
VVKELGFKYKTLITWAKTRIGLGQYFRGQTEHVLFATSGKARVPPPSRRSSTLLGADPLEKRIHSRKPVALYSVIEEVSEGPYLEMFARSKREGWDSWGNETDKF